MSDEKIRVGITQGDINGIGYEVIIKTFMDPRMVELCTPVVYGSPKVAAYHRKALNVENFSFNHIRDAAEANPKRVNIINCMDDEVRVELGKSTEEGGKGSLLALEAAMPDLKAGKIDVLITAPINKANIQSAKFSFPGHTEYLASSFNAKEFLMLMVGDLMRVGVVTGHVPLSKVSSLITRDTVLGKIRLLNQTLVRDFAIRRPRIAVLGLNPHAGDAGLLGGEEESAIIPAIKQAADEGIAALGPYPADGLFGSDGFTRFDAILAMYHDQGLTPFKAICFDSGVNYTAGLPVIRTSPDHGTAYDLAGQNLANPNSFRNALYLAIDIFNNRKLHDQLTTNPLSVSSSENG
ncbi:MAG TPA: 4-hydroxythreonine-4-phosphate dehydrogenase PdxA [Tenuifilaceae bacterium]|jgi:4-hydroxythreonine-4-phosphate dehydrogenase|nr:4-hydroxythreonine-4-phosphate dehydrogenase PdxA [Bacteroidales bacterium]HNY09804.1 4-hydroxythreonine-4-phosphate dehydrogenase PdxA [Tenuifilaceae bacterium]MBP8642989.1 4-hydroxythreonine-4-phosphate dehydrogenase PdxA [Bacteroidales bacterium]HOC35988.1 4-hydroxythreonine-4-phosphate dehydrogenase PdxA [Tenuifilaceae bacterium]HPA68040.1 4-hydroxythreonine-4-phosphate dehydrogenase PdxA [Tenuifilaceae bacterium]